MKKKIDKLLLVSLLGIFTLPSFAQNKFHVAIDYHYLFGLSEKGSYNISRKDSKMYGNSLHLTALYNFTSQITGGLGLGADRYESPGYNTFPIYASLQYSFLRHLPNIYTYSNIGYAFINKNDTYSGLTWDLGCGYKKMIRSHFGYNLNIGYNLKQFEKVVDNDNNTRHSLSFGFGVIF